MRSKSANVAQASRLHTHSKAPQAGRLRYARGLTLVEVLIVLAIFIILACMTLMAVREVVAQWTVGERRRVLYEKAAGVLDLMTDDIKLAVTMDGPGATVVRAKLIGDFDKNNGQQRLMFCRSFESGPERALVFNAGDGRVNDLNFTPPDNADPNAVQKAPAKGPIKIGPDTDVFTGRKVGDYKALGGMAMVGYFLNIDPNTHERSLCRAIHAPVEGPMTANMDPAGAELVASDVLWVGFEYWTQNTDTWEEQPSDSKEHGPEKIWDSTRGIKALNKFSLYRGTESLNDPEDDVFPQMIKVIVTVDSPMPRCVHTKLLDEIGDAGGDIAVESTRGFPDGGDDDSWLLIDDEWLHYKRKTEQAFYIDGRGRRGSTVAGHVAKANVRVGHTFHRIVYIPNWRSNFETDEHYFARKRAEKLPAQVKKVNNDTNDQ